MGDLVRGARSLSEYGYRDRAPSRLLVEEQYDIDSFFLHAQGLEIFRGNLNLSYTPSFHSAIVQDPHVTFQGKHIHRCKQIRVASGAFWCGALFQCHLIFPHLRIYGGQVPTMTERQSRVWTDEIVLPSLRRACPADVLQHHPRSFLEALCKSQAHKEDKLFSERDSSIDLRAVVPARFVGPFWRAVCEILRGADDNPDLIQFRDPIIIISSHDLKCHFKADTAAQALRAFRDQLSQTFDLSYAYGAHDEEPPQCLDRPWDGGLPKVR